MRGRVFHPIRGSTRCHMVSLLFEISKLIKSDAGTRSPALLLVCGLLELSTKFAIRLGEERHLPISLKMRSRAYEGKGSSPKKFQEVKPRLYFKERPMGNAMGLDRKRSVREPTSIKWAGTGDAEVVVYRRRLLVCYSPMVGKPYPL